MAVAFGRGCGSPQGGCWGQLNYQAAGALLHQPAEPAPACRRTRRSSPSVVAQMPR